jgi:HEPN domain-containing protein/predicted nucleotidyltransferase
MVTIKEAKTVSDDLASRFMPSYIYCFGSVARKGIGNDLDMLIVVDDSVNEMRAADREIQRYLVPYFQRFEIDPFIVGLSVAQEHLKNGSPFLESILDEGVLLYMKNAFQEWEKRAVEDLAMARHLYSGEFYRGACYHAQQSVEKFLKMRLLAKGWPLEKIHTIRRLTALSEQYKIQVELQEDEINFLDSIYRSRYPAESGLLPQGEPGKTEAEHAIQIAEMLVQIRIRIHP